MNSLPSYPLRAVHLTAAWAFAVSQPVFSMLLGNPEFLVVRGANRLEVLGFALSLALIPPLAAVLCTRLVSVVWRAAADVLYVSMLGVLVVLLVAQILKKLGFESTAILLIGWVAAAVFAAAYLRWAAARLLFTAAVCLPVVGFLLFVARAPIVTEDVTGAGVRVTSKTPVVLVVFDEFPVSSLMTPAGDLDAVRYPSFARLSRDATWYRRATTVHDHTTLALPAILTGRIGQKGGLPTLAHYPDNLFTLLGESYRLKVTEQFTYLCPNRYCPRDRDPFFARMNGLFADVAIAFSHRVLPVSMASELPRVDDRWGGFAKERVLVADDSAEIGDVGAKGNRDALFAAFLDEIARVDPDSTLYFVHSLYPHFPWRHVRSGLDIGAPLENFGLDEGLEWTDESWVVQQAYQRHLLQVGYADALLGRLLQRLERLGIYDRTLVIVTADHGISFVPGAEARAVTPETIADIASVPLFIKFPGRREGAIDDRVVRSVDILPTVADVLDVEVPWTMDGQSLLGSRREPTTVSVATDDGSIVEVRLEKFRQLSRTTLRRKNAFGRTWDSLLWAGRGRGVRGADVDSIRVGDDDRARVIFDQGGRLANVDISSGYVPAWLTGTIEGLDMAPRELVVAVNGRIVGAAGVIGIRGEQHFSALVPEAAFRNGPNHVELLAVDRQGRTLRLVRLGKSGSRVSS